MRRVGIDDSRLFSLAGKPYALFAGVAPVGQARGKAFTRPNRPDAKLPQQQSGIRFLFWEDWP